MALTKRTLKETEKEILAELDELVYQFDFQEHVQDETGQFVELDHVELVRKFLNIRFLCHFRQDLIASVK